MKLDDKQLRSLIHGAYSIKERDGGFISFTHYTDEQVDYLTFNTFYSERAVYSSSVTLEFAGTAEKIALTYRVFGGRPSDTIEAFADGVPVSIFHTEGNVIEAKAEFTLPAGEKNVVVYLPLDFECGIKDVEIDGEWAPVAPRETKVLWIGDSITQGYGTFRTAETYVNVANRTLGYEILNQGIGGYWYDERVMKSMPGYRPDKIIVAMGTNQHRSPDKLERVTKFYEALANVYPGVPVLAITPIWRGDPTSNLDELKEISKMIADTAAKYDNIRVIDGFTLVPNLKEYYFDLLHPNALGGHIYGENLAACVKKIGF